MSFMEWRRFNFFDLSKNVDEGKIQEALKGSQVTASSSGHSHLVFGDSDGFVHLVNRSFEATTYRAHEGRVGLVHNIQNSSLLITIGEDEGGSTILKVWDTEKKDKQGSPICLRSSRLHSATKGAAATALAVHQNHLLAVGFSDGTVLLQRGEVGRERSLKQVVLRDGANSVSGLAFRITARAPFLFVATTVSVLLYNIANKDKEQRIQLDSAGCELSCCVATDCIPECNFIIGRSDAIYCYTTEGRGPCYAIEGKKKLLQISRTYLVVVAEDKNKAVGSSSDENAISCETVTVLDLQNKFLVFTAPAREVQAVLSEWGYFLVLTAGNNLLGLMEKDVQSKLAMLFKKNLYDVAIRIAKSHHYGPDGLSDIFRQFGDHLYNKGDHSGAIEQYIKTIDKLEPSYIIRKYLDSQLIEHLTTYLQALHKHGLAGEDHTTLLLNCYTKLNRTDKLREFLLTKDRDLDFDVDTAIKVCRQVSSEDALTLAKKHGRHEWYLKIQLEDKHEYDKVLEYLAQLPFNEAEANIKRYGSLLIQHVPQETTDFLKRLCTDFRPNGQPAIDRRESDRHEEDKACPEDFIHLFLENSEMLIQFLENMVQVDPHASSLVYNTLLEHYLQVWEASKGDEKKQLGEKVLRLLQNSDANYDRAQTLILCQLHHFSQGLLFLYEEAKMYQHMMRYHSVNKDYEGLLACCRKFGAQDPGLWIEALSTCTKDHSTPSKVLSEVLQVIERERLLPPLMVIDALAESNALLGDVRSYLVGVLKAEEELTKQEEALIEKYTNETKAIRQQIRAIETSNVIFRANLCNACNQHLELPSVHFLCQHSFHQHCFESCSESDHECPVCLPNNKKIMDIIKSQDQSRSLHESFHSQLERAQDGFSLVADYFGRGVFNPPPSADAPSVTQKKFSEPPKDNLGTEARLRLMEGGGAPKNIVCSSSDRYDSWSSKKSAPEAPVLSSSQRFESWSGPPAKKSPQPATRQANRSPQPPAKNPFDDSPEYDDAKNPFADEDAAPRETTPKKSTPKHVNPFEEEEDDDYDKNLNPFGED
ncbi:vacuolar protein sorting-associated protein 11 homolog [Neocloeon triangulifer]|uniref:vacuolar protein sorting-associated protein 11 homolog n=1 Tax=Neocloeon triangulifer TaxID=2078957 RepID=UPI00286F8F22|nr:vacuolar protein sorting-associated protein 11 homolog [Neocloeon triangulifer]